MARLGARGWVFRQSLRLTSRHGYAMAYTLASLWVQWLANDVRQLTKWMQAVHADHVMACRLFAALAAGRTFATEPVLTTAILTRLAADEDRGVREAAAAGLAAAARADFALIRPYLDEWVTAAPELRLLVALALVPLCRERLQPPEVLVPLVDQLLASDDSEVVKWVGYGLLGRGLGEGYPELTLQLIERLVDAGRSGTALLALQGSVAQYDPVRTAALLARVPVETERERQTVASLLQRLSTVKDHPSN